MKPKKKKLPASGTVVVGDKPIESLYAEAWKGIMEASRKMSERKPEGPGWITYEDYGKRMGVSPTSIRHFIGKHRKRGLIETHEGGKVTEGGKWTRVFYVRPILNPKTA